MSSHDYLAPIICFANRFDLPEAHLVCGLKQSGFEVIAVMEPGAPHAELLLNSGVEVMNVPLRSRVDLRAACSVRKIVKERGVALIHSFSGRALSAALLGTIGLPVRHSAYRGTMGNLSRWDPSSWLTFLNPRISRLSCVSQAVADSLAEAGVPREKLVQIYKGHDPRWYEVKPKVDLKSFGVGAEEFLVACVANVRPVKGVDLLIKAFEFIPKEFPIKLLLIGEVRDDQVEHAIKSQAGRIISTGYRSDASAIVRECQLFCMPSRRREGLPKGVIEAMIQGVPALVTQVGGMPEIVRDGQDGLVVPAEDPQALARAIISCFQERLRLAAFAQSSRKRIQEKFSLETTVEKTAGMFRTILDMHSR